jgi:class 3 adenylate cyclase
MAIFDYEMIDILDEKLLNPIVETVVSNSADTLQKRLTVICYIMMTMTFLLSLGAFIATILDLRRIQSAFRFVLSTLSMVESRRVLQNSALLAVFADNFQWIPAASDALIPAFERAQDESDQCIILLNHDDTIACYNKQACNLFRFDSQIASHMPLNRVLVFETPPSEETFDTNVTVVNFRTVFRMRVSKIPLEQKEQSVLFLFDLTGVDVKSHRIAEMETEVERLRQSIIPSGVTEMQMDVHDCVIVIVDLYDFSSFLRDHSAEEAAARLSCFIAIIDAAITADGKVTKLRQFGSVVWVVFNFVPHSLQPLSQTSLDAIAFARKVGEALHLEEIEFRMGIAVEADARAGIASRDRLLFDFYSAAMSTASTLARRAAPATALIVPDVAQFEPPRTLAVVQLTLADVSAEFYELRIQ